MSAVPTRALVLLALAGSPWSSSWATDPPLAPAADGMASPVPSAEVIITGSRFPRRLIDTTGPMQVISVAESNTSGATSISELLQSSPFQNGAAFNGNRNLGGDGTSKINLRGLGPLRSLVLLNGRRMVFGGLGADTAVDLDAIPRAMIERIEISGSGASATYGSDAVAGVVNLITRRPRAGFSIAATRQTDEDGDGPADVLEATAGSVGAHMAWLAGAELIDRKAVSQAARGYSAQVESLSSLDGSVLPTGTLLTPQGVFDVLPGNALGLPRAPTNPLHVLLPGTTGRSRADYRSFDPRTDYFNYAPYALLQTPTRRLSAWLLAEGQGPRASHWFAEALVQERRSQQSAGLPTYNSNALGVAPFIAALGTQAVPANNAYNPFGVPVLGVLRTITEGEPQFFEQSADTSRLLVGLRGDLQRWAWETSLGWAMSRIRHRQNDQLLRDRLVLAAGPSGRDTSGRIVCGTPAPGTGIVPADAIVAGCVPLNLFGGQGVDGRGTITPEMLAYVSSDLTDRGRNELWTAEGLSSGPWGRLPAGEIRWATGLQFKRDSGLRALDPLRGSGVSASLALGVPAATANSTAEVFVETSLPLLAQRRGAQAVDLTLGLRQSEDQTYGSHFATQAGLRWRATRAFALRANVATVFRAPASLELFSARVDDITFLNDPCGIAPTPQQQANCLAAGVPGGRYVRDPSARPAYVTGGNAGLQPERGRTWSVGLQFGAEDSSWRASIDQWRIDLEDLILLPGAQQIVAECANGGAAESCGRITRRADGSVLAVDARFANLSRAIVSGTDVAIRGRGESGFGRWLTELTATRHHKDLLYPFDPGPVTDLGGAYSLNLQQSRPRWHSSAAAQLQRGAWRLGYRVQYIGAMTECGDKNPPIFVFLAPTACRRIDDRLYHDLSAGVTTRRGLSLRLGVDNLAGADPPRVNLSTTANTDPTIYRLLGRVYTLDVKFEPGSESGR